MASLEAGPITPDNLLKSYSAVYVESWSKANHPHLRCWFGASSNGPNGQVADGWLNEFRSFYVVPPLGFTDRSRAPDYVWNELDRFMTDDPSCYHVVGRAQLEGRSMIVVDKFPPNSDRMSSLILKLFIAASPTWLERTRAWIDPSQSFLPMRLEKTFVDPSKKNQDRSPHCVIEVTEVKQVAGSYYPTRGEKQDFVTGRPLGAQAAGTTVGGGEVEGRSQSPSAARLERNLGGLGNQTPRGA